MRSAFLFLLLLLNTTLSAQTPESRARLSGQLLERLQEKNWTGAVRLFDASLAQKLDSVQLAMIWQGLQISHGPLLSIGTASEKTAASRLFHYRRLDFEKTAMRMELEFNAQQQISSLRMQALTDEELYLPPPYEHANNYHEFSMRVRHDTVVLPAILTIPKSCVNCPAVLLIHDLGPQDRDHSIGPTRMFRDMAIGLANQGIISLRYDKRSFRYGPELMEDLRVLKIENEILEDARAALALFRGVQEVDTHNISIIGLGMGGMLAGEIAASAGIPIQAIVSIGSSPRPLAQQLLDQYIQLLSSKMSFGEMQQQVKALEKQSKLATNPKLDPNTSPDLLPLQLPAPYWLRLQQFDPAAGYWRSNARLLFLRGENDFQSSQEDLRLWEMRLLGHSKSNFESLPGLNHLLMPDAGQPAAEAYTKPAHLSPEAISRISSFLLGP
ncbi:MAG: dienelactone hydrolase family protein [Bacteroidia bacterium]